jgi:hypothetical protein
VTLPPARREPFARRLPLPRSGLAVRRALATLLVTLLAALTPVLSAAPASAAGSGRAVPAAQSTGTAAAHGSSTSQESRRGLRSTGHRSPGASGRRQASNAGAPRQVQRQQGGQLHTPTCPGAGSADPTGPPSTYAVATIRPSSHPLCGSHHPAAAGRAPPSSSGS